MSGVRALIPALATARTAAARKVDWLMTDSDGHKVLTLIIAFAAPWVIFS